MKIGVIGAGNIGGTLSRKWAAAGHNVMVAARESTSPRALSLKKDLGENAQLGSVEETVEFGDVIVFAIPGAAMAQTVPEVAAPLGSKHVIDATNNIGNPVMNAIERIKQAAPNAQVFRAFNSLGWEVFANPRFGNTTADLFYCGPSDGREIVEELIGDVGLRPMYVGDLRSAHVVDSLAGLYFAFTQRLGRRLGFKLLSD